MKNLKKVRGILAVSLLFIAISCTSQQKPGSADKSEENKGSTFYVTIPLEGMKKKEGSKRFEIK